MLLSARHLVDRLRHPRSRADEVLEVRRRLLAQPAPADASDEELAAASELARLRVELLEAFRDADVRSCGSCARGRSLPHGRWNGGHCCGANTEDLFTDDELAALRLAGTTAASLTLPPAHTDHAGCAFRGPEGCSLDPTDRPNLCARFVCRELHGELAESPAGARVKSLARQLGEAFAKFSEARDS